MDNQHIPLEVLWEEGMEWAWGVVVCPSLGSTVWTCFFQQMCQIVSWREHHHAFSNLFRKVSKVTRHEPCASIVRQRKELNVLRVWPTMRPLRGVGKAQAFVDEKLQPKRRKPKTVKLGTFQDGPILFDDQRTGHYL